MTGVCDDEEKFSGEREHILCCDAHKKESEICTSPLNKARMNKIAYKLDGTIYTEPRDDIMEKDINKILLLNGIRKSDGSVRDTSAELLKGKQDVYDGVRRRMEYLNKSGKCTFASVKKIIINLQK